MLAGAGRYGSTTYINTTGFRMPGTAADAMIAVKITQSGAVWTFSSLVGECVSYGMTDTFKMLCCRLSRGHRFTVS